MSLEERYILPEFARRQVLRAETLLLEHETLRKQLQQDIDVDLHLGRSEQAQQIVRQLKAHALREDALMYRFVDRGLESGTSRELLERALLGDRPT